MKQRYCKCRIQTGMFSNEYLIIIDKVPGLNDNIDDKDKSWDWFFADKYLVKLINNESPPKELDDVANAGILVYVGERNKDNGLNSISFPQQPYKHSVYYQVPDDWLFD